MLVRLIKDFCLINKDLKTQIFQPTLDIVLSLVKQALY